MDPVEIGSLSTIHCRYTMVHDDLVNVRVLIAAFEGTFRYGSKGNPDGLFIAAETMRGLAAFDPDALVLDFAPLDYEWGDGLLSVFQSIDRYMNEKGDQPFPVHVVTSDNNRGAVLSLMGQDEEDADWHHRKLDEAVTTAKNTAREWLDAV